MGTDVVALLGELAASLGTQLERVTIWPDACAAGHVGGAVRFVSGLCGHWQVDGSEFRCHLLLEGQSLDELN
jgi:hypothetical protein